MKKLFLLLCIICGLYGLSWANLGESIEGQKANPNVTHTSKLDSAKFIFYYPYGNDYKTVYGYPDDDDSLTAVDTTVAGMDLDSMGLHIVKITYYPHGGGDTTFGGSWLHVDPFDASTDSTYGYADIVLEPQLNSKYIYVKTDGSDDSSGLTWNAAVAHPEKALLLCTGSDAYNIFVASGTYTDASCSMNVSNVKMHPVGVVILQGASDKPVFYLGKTAAVQGIDIEGFVVQAHGGGTNDHGFLLDSVAYCRIVGNIIQGAQKGISAGPYPCSLNIIMDNIIVDNDADGMHLGAADQNLVEGNIIDNLNAGVGDGIIFGVISGNAGIHNWVVGNIVRNRSGGSAFATAEACTANIFVDNSAFGPTFGTDFFSSTIDNQLLANNHQNMRDSSKATNQRHREVIHDKADEITAIVDSLFAFLRGGRRHVWISTTGHDDSSGLSPSAAKTTLRGAGLACDESGATGCVIHVLPGNYVSAKCSMVTIDSVNISWIGAGAGQTILNQLAGQDLFYVNKGSAGYIGTEIAGFTMIGNGSNEAIEYFQGSGSYIHDNTFVNFNIGINATHADGEYLIVTNNRFFDMTSDHIKYYGDWWVIDQNWMDSLVNGDADAIAPTATADRGFITNNYIAGITNGYGIHMLGTAGTHATGILVANNYVGHSNPDSAYPLQYSSDNYYVGNHGVTVQGISKGDTTNTIEEDMYAVYVEADSTLDKTRDLVYYFGTCDDCYQVLYPNDGSANKDSVRIINPALDADSIVATVHFIAQPATPTVYDTSRVIIH